MSRGPVMEGGDKEQVDTNITTDENGGGVDDGASHGIGGNKQTVDNEAEICHGRARSKPWGGRGWGGGRK